MAKSALVLVLLLLVGLWGYAAGHGDGRLAGLKFCSSILNAPAPDQPHDSSNRDGARD